MFNFLCKINYMNDFIDMFRRIWRAMSWIRGKVLELTAYGAVVMVRQFLLLTLIIEFVHTILMSCQTSTCK